jgi:hypothetical protein
MLDSSIYSYNFVFFIIPCMLKFRINTLNTNGPLEFLPSPPKHMA